MRYSSLLRYALAFAFVLAGTGLAQAQQLTPEEAEELGVETTADRPADDQTAAARGGLQVCVDDVLLIPDSGLDGVATFDPATGDLVDPAFISDSGNLSTPINAIPNFDGDGIFVSDQIEDVVYEYDCDGNFVGIFAPAGGVDETILNNIRGMDYNPAGDVLWVTVGSGDNEDTIAAFDTDGNYLGNFTDQTGSPFDVYTRDSDVLVGDIDNEDILRFDFSGVLLDTLVDGDGITSLDFPEQIAEADNGNLLVAGFSTPSGVYEYDADGNQVGFYDVETGLRGVYELPNGNLLVTNSGGVSEITRSNTIVRDGYAEADRFIELFAVDAGDPIEIDASPDAQSVPQGGTASFSYTVENNTAMNQSGVVFYEVFRDGNQVIGPQQVQSGTLQPGQSVTASFDVNVPGNAPTGDYDVEISAGNSLGNPAATDIVAVTVTPAPRTAGSATSWTLADATSWQALDAAATAAPGEVGAYPNPLREQTTLTFSLDESAEVRLAVYDVLGRQVALLADGPMEAGEHTAQFDARGLAAGTYVYRLQVGDTVQTGRLTVVY